MNFRCAECCGLFSSLAHYDSHDCANVLRRQVAAQLQPYAYGTKTPPVVSIFSITGGGHSIKGVSIV